MLFTERARELYAKARIKARKHPRSGGWPEVDFILTISMLEKELKYKRRVELLGYEVEFFHVREDYKTKGEWW